ncbi:Copper type II ascorbate-dependent monooxygenase, C-terminal domain [Sphingobacterium spiritivorum]|uniref:Copper type II ascorbate-dependent monooxygenase, C-terminal domain n=1 Tax=Sphingobacterium spiritivorum TaxID=258 RepID=A0A380BVF9_SPHSI|nr:cytochrome c [Sphingobacterium spiritivorum]SUJ07789.1 Copper type II ascorbate-dependent monooxygenase, C-terminal domain [Sphingobacterium spiritivorum]
MTKEPHKEIKKQQNTLSKTTSPIDRKPDLILKINKPFIVKGNNKERFVLFKVPFELLEDKNIEGVEFYSDNKKVVHHVNYMFSSVPDMSVDLYQGDPYIDNAEETDMKKLMQYEPFQNRPVFYTGWIPGASVEYYPKDFGWTLPKRGVVIFTVHYSATAADEQSTIGVNLYFKKTPAKRPVRIISLGSGGIGEKDIYPRFVIPPDQESTFSLKIRTPEDQSLLYVWPHMHYLGKDFKAFAVTLQNDTIPLIHIPKWNFEWQEMYRMKKLVKVPAGSTINIVGTFDNTANNPQNPNSPPKYVYSTGNMTSTDEMLTFLLIYAPYQSGDEEILLE